MEAAIVTEKIISCGIENTRSPLKYRVWGLLLPADNLWGRNGQHRRFHFAWPVSFPQRDELKNSLILWAGLTGARTITWSRACPPAFTTWFKFLGMAHITAFPWECISVLFKGTALIGSLWKLNKIIQIQQKRHSTIEYEGARFSVQYCKKRIMTIQISEWN